MNDELSEDFLPTLELPPPETELTELDEMLRAARRVLERGWYVFGCAYKKKIPYRGTNGHNDALNSGNAAEALQIWTNPTNSKRPRNPAINLSKSGLVVVDVDYGFEDLTDSEVITKAESLGLPQTYTVRSGSTKGGAHFYYAGSIPKNVPFKNINGLSGDLKYNGFVIAEGGMHQSGNRYRLINDVPVAPLPDMWRDYRLPDPKSKPNKLQGMTPFELDCLRRDGSLNQDPELKRAYESLDKQKKQMLRSANRVTVPFNKLVRGGYRWRFLTRQIQFYRARSLTTAAIRILVDIDAMQQCEDGLNYAKKNQERLDRQVFGYGASLRMGDIDLKPIKGKVVIRRKRSKASVMAEIIGTFPDGIPSSEALTLLAERLAEREIPFDRKADNDLKTVSRARRLAGFAVKGRLWLKHPHQRGMPIEGVD
jgi:hypothetical protein